MNVPYHACIAFLTAVCIVPTSLSFAQRPVARGIDNAPTHGSMGAKKERDRESKDLARRGFNLVRTGEPKAALPLLHQSLVLKDSNGIAYIGLAEAYAELGDYRKSLEYYRSIMYRTPAQGWHSSLTNDYEHLIGFATVLQRVGAIQESEKAYIRALAFVPSDVAGYLYSPIGNRQTDTRKMTASLHLASAVLFYERGRDSRLPSVHNVGLQKQEQAIRQAISTAPDYAPAYLMLGETLEHQSQRESAQKKPGGGATAKREAFQAYKRAAMLGTGDTKTAAQKGLKGYWFADMATPKP